MNKPLGNTASDPFKDFGPPAIGMNRQLSKLAWTLLTLYHPKPLNIPNILKPQP